MPFVEDELMEVIVTEDKCDSEKNNISKDNDVVMSTAVTDFKSSGIANASMFLLYEEINRQNFEAFDANFKMRSNYDLNELRILLCKICDTNFRCVKVQIAFVKLFLEKDMGICFLKYNDSNYFIIEQIFSHCNINIFIYIFEIMSNGPNLIATLKAIFARSFKLNIDVDLFYTYDNIPLFKKIFENRESYDRFMFFHNAVDHAIRQKDESTFLLNINKNKYAAVLFAYSVSMSDYKQCKYLLDSGISIFEIENISLDHFRIHNLSVLHILFDGLCSRKMFRIMHILIARGMNVCKYTVSKKSLLEHALASKLSNYLIVWPFIFLQKFLAAKGHFADCSEDSSLLEGRLNSACARELRRLKNHKISENFSLYSIMYQTVDSLVYVLENRECLFYNLNFQEIAKEYTLYGNYIVTKVLLICERKKYLELARWSLSFIYKHIANALRMDYLPAPIIEKIENYLSISDLNLLKATASENLNTNASCFCKNYLSNSCFCNEGFWYQGI